MEIKGVIPKITLDIDYLYFEDGDLVIADNPIAWFRNYIQTQQPYKNGDFYDSVVPDFDVGVDIIRLSKQNKIDNKTINNIQVNLKERILKNNPEILGIDVSLNNGEFVINVK
jgi:hypothetical protein